MMDHVSVDELGAYGFSPEATACLRQSGMAKLLPFQVEAIRNTRLLRGGNLLAFAPTSAGKTFLGEMTALRHWQTGRKTVFLTPTRALTTEQHRHLQSRYGPLGLTIVKSTADQTRDDARIRKGDFDLAVLVYEKFRSFLVSCPDLLYSLGAVVADELQILNDPERGETADLVLTRLVQGEPPVQVIGLTAVIDGAEQVADWLNAELLRSATRPAELREGAFCAEHGVFHYKGAGSDPWADEVLPGVSAAFNDLRDTDGIASAVDLAVQLARSGENCLVFVPTRALSRSFAMAAARELGMSADDAPAKCRDLLEAEESVIREQLLQCMPARVAFHNADLTSGLRALVEHQFNAGDIRVLVATPTLAQGVNLRAKNVIQLPVMVNTDALSRNSTTRTVQTPLSVDRYRNQAGRAGRVGTGEAFGRSILMARNHADASRLARAYIDADLPPAKRDFSAETLEHLVLDFVDSGIAATFSTICEALKQTFAWRCNSPSHNDIEDQLAECVRRLLEFEMLDESAGHRLRITALGQVAAAGGFQAVTLREMLTWCREWTSRPPSDFELLLACAFTADGELFPLTASHEEIRSGLWLRAAHAQLNPDSDNFERASEVLWPRGGLSRAGHAAAKLAVVCSGWITHRETAELERDYKLVAGTIASGAAHVAWLAGALAGCARVADCTDSVVTQITELSTRLPEGLSPKAASFANLEIPGFTRNYIHQAINAGFDTPAALKEAETDILAKTLTPSLATKLKNERCNSAAKPKSHSTLLPIKPIMSTPSIKSIKPTHTLEPADTPAPEPVKAPHPEPPPSTYDLILDPNNPGTVIFRGRSIQLSPKPYALLGVLARHCGSTVAYRNIDELVWPDEKVEPQQISAHKSRLIRELARATTKEDAQQIIQTAPRYGLRLNLPPSKVLATH